jgi:hypothetical protein
MAEENKSEPIKKQTKLEKIAGYAILGLVPASGILGFMKCRKELEYPFDSAVFMGILEATKFNAYAVMLGKLSAYLC